MVARCKVWVVRDDSLLAHVALRWHRRLGRLIAPMADVGASITGKGACVVVNSLAAAIRVVAWGKVWVVRHYSLLAHVTFTHR